MDGDDTVLGLANLTAPLALHAGGVGAFLGLAGLVDQADAAEVIGAVGGRPLGQALLQLVTHLVLVPDVVTQELLEGADRRARSQGDGLDALAGQVGQQAPTVGVQMLTGAFLGKAVVKLPQVGRKGRTQSSHLFRCHGALRRNVFTEDVLFS